MYWDGDDGGRGGLVALLVDGGDRGDAGEGVPVHVGHVGGVEGGREGDGVVPRIEKFLLFPLWAPSPFTFLLEETLLLLLRSRSAAAAQVVRGWLACLACWLPGSWFSHGACCCCCKAAKLLLLLLLLLLQRGSYQIVANDEKKTHVWFSPLSVLNWLQSKKNMVWELPNTYSGIAR